jgi:hypothetical protein
MGTFSRIKEKLFGHSEQQPDHTVTAGASQPGTADMAANPTTGITTDRIEPKTSPSLQKEVTTTLAGVDAKPSTIQDNAPVDVAAIMDAAVKKNGQDLDWRRSIVDTMKALDLDSSLLARKELADELGFTGDKNDSATMNIWVHKALMKALADNGGKVPAELLD